MSSILEIVLVLTILLGMGIIPLLVGLLLMKIRLVDFKGVLIMSINSAIVFGFGSYGLITLSKKFQSWSIIEKFRYSSEIAVYTFVGAAIVVFILFNNFSKRIKK